MAMRIQNMPKKDFDPNSVIPVSHFSGNYPSWWGINEQQVPQTFPKNFGSKDVSPPPIHHEGKNLGLALAEQDSSSTQSMGISQHETSVVGGVDSQDHSISSESGPDESSCKSGDGQMKPFFLFSNPEVVFYHSQADNRHPWPRVPYPPVDPYFGGLLAAYGPQTIIQPQMGSQIVGMAPTRVPLPLNLSEDGPIYVNAKQYHGILRRRQSRAKLEAQNKLVKSRKPYLHESRHLHALNRVRGSGGRFLSTKKLLQSDPSSTSSSKNPETALNLKDASLLESHHSGTTLQFTPTTAPTCSEATNVPNCDVYYLPTNSRFSGITSRVGGGGAMQHGRGLMCGAAAQHCSPSVR